MLGSPILYLKGMRILMFQLSGFYCRSFKKAFWEFGCTVHRAPSTLDPKHSTLFRLLVEVVGV